MFEAPLARHRERVRSEWIDYNGHMNVAYYMLVFDRGTDFFLDAIGLGAAYAAGGAGSVFALESHVVYKRELMLDAPVAVTTQLIDYDEKRIHFFHRLIHESEGFEAATLEQMSTHVDLARRRSSPMPAEAQGRLEAMMAAHRQLDRPAELGSRIGIRRRSAPKS